MRGDSCTSYQFVLSMGSQVGRPSGRVWVASGSKSWCASELFFCSPGLCAGGSDRAPWRARSGLPSTAGARPGVRAQAVRGLMLSDWPGELARTWVGGRWMAAHQFIKKRPPKSVHLFVCACVSICVYMCLHVYVDMCMFVSVFMCMLYIS